MTITNAVELIRQQFPEYGDTQILQELDLSQKIFANETKLGRKKFDSTSVTLLAEGDVEIVFDGSNVVYSVTTDVLGLVMNLTELKISQVEKVFFMDAQNTILSDILMWDYIDNILHFYNGTNTPLTVFPPEIKKMVMVGIIKPNNITTLGSMFTIPEEFHYAVIADILKRFLAIKGALEPAAFWSAEYSRYRVNAKRYSNESMGANYIALSELGV